MIWRQKNKCYGDEHLTVRVVSVWSGSAASERRRHPEGGIPLPIQAILVATDLGVHSVAAMEHALDLALSVPVKVHIVYVKRDFVLALGPEPFLTTAAIFREQTSSPDLELRRLHHRLLDFGVESEVHVVEGAPAVEIGELARRLGVDLIVMGTRSGGGLQRLLFGSITEQVCQSAPCPVTVVRTPGSAPPH
jgi:nucleotide-binding universal stress UspA family protein